MGSMNRADVHDRSALLRKQGQGSLRQEERTAKIYIQDRIPISSGKVGKGAFELYGGVVDQEIEMPCALAENRNRRLNLCVTR